MLIQLQDYLKPGVQVLNYEDRLEVPIPNPSSGLKANAYYFNHPDWAPEYFKYVHRSKTFTRRWRAALGNWDGKVVVDIGCGPGNLFASVKGRPAVIIGVDVAVESLKMAKKIGYLPILADAHDLPLNSGFADVVTLNATLHHCDDMTVVLKEAARLLNPAVY